MNVLFLDIDGVLITHKSMAHEVPLIDLDNEHFAEEAVNTLIEIIREHNFNVVLSSSWRLFKMDFIIVEKLLQKFNVEILDTTPDFRSFDLRHKEIAQWLSENPEVKKFVILDDDDMGSLSPFHIKTTWFEGLKPEHKKMVKAIMEK